MRIFKYDLAPSSNRDFINPYIGVVLWSENQNPYDDYLLKAKWKQIKTEENLHSSFTVGKPDNPFVYPIITIPLLSFLHYFTYSQALKIWLTLCAIGLIIIYIYSIKLMGYYELNSFADKLWFTGIFLSLKFLYPSFFLGQPSIIAFAFAITGYYYFLKDKVFLSAILFSLSAIKITILFPFILLLILYRKWNILSIVFCILIIAVAVYFIKEISINDTITEYSKNIEALTSEIYTIKDGNYLTDLMTKNTELNSITTYFSNTNQHNTIIKIIYTLLLILALKPMLGFLKKEKMMLWLIVSIWSLLIMYHLIYDLIILIPMYIVFRKCQLNKWKQLSFILFLLVLIIPINTILDKINSPGPLLSILYLHIPIALIALQFFMIYHIRRNVSLNTIKGKAACIN